VTSVPIELLFSFEATLPAMRLPQQRQWAAVAGELTKGQPILLNAASSVLDGQRVTPVEETTNQGSSNGQPRNHR